MKFDGAQDRQQALSFVEGHFCILLATVFFGVNIPVAKMLIPHWMTAMDLTVFRLCGGCLLMWLASLFLKTTSLAKSDFKKVLLGGVFGIFLFIFLFNVSLRYGDPIDISIIMTLPPVFVILIGAIFLHRRVSWLEWAGVSVAFVGAFMIIASRGSDASGSHKLMGDLFALASALCYSFYLVIMEGPSKSYSPVSYLRWVFLFAAIPAMFLIPAFPHAEIFRHADDFVPWMLIGFVVVCPTFLSYFLISPATRLIGSELVSLYQYLVPVIATIASVAMGLAKLHWLQVVAMVVIVFGMVLTNIAKHREKVAR